MTETVTEIGTPSSEVRDAAKALRCDHSFPIQPPNGSLAYPGDCEKCGVPYTHSEPVTDDARDIGDKLADLFDHLADAMAEGGAVEWEVRLDDGRRRKFVFCKYKARDQEPNEMWTAALRLARQIHGKAA